jgi:hypothetical protein
MASGRKKVQHKLVEIVLALDLGPVPAIAEHVQI